jgi:TldD protein
VALGRLVRSAAALAALALLGIAGDGAVQAPAPAPVLVAMRAELARSMDDLKRQPAPPYFLSYEITERREMTVRGAFGTITASDDARQRLLNIDLRVGSPVFDNSHPARGVMDFADFEDRFSMVRVPLDDDPAAIRRILWYETDQKFKHAVERLARARTSAQVLVAPEDSAPDFAPEPAVSHVEPAVDIGIDRAAWEQKIRAYTAPFAHAHDIYEGEASLKAERETRWYVNSDGSQLQLPSVYYRLVISAYTKAEDGMELPRYESFVASTPDRLPDDATVLKTVDHMIADLYALRQAPVVDAYTGPAILSGRASGVFFHEVFGHRIEGHRQKNENEGQTFKKMVGQKILPDAFSVYFDPTQRQLGNTELAGYYLYDDEGVQARRVDVVKDGVFRNFLMSRSPIAGFARSNGHGRSQPGFGVVARQSNLVVTTRAPVSHMVLKQRLIDLIRQQNRPFGLLFDDIQGGFTITQRDIPNAFNVIPVMVYRVYPDGREELVRGVDFIGTPLTVFSKIVAAGDETRTFNGICGAESGWVPVSASSPDLLISQIEVQKKGKSQEKAPILPPPAANDHAAGQP